MSEICDICGGRGFIILPTKPHLRAGPGVLVSHSDDPKPLRAGVETKQFGCPQCNPTVGGEPIKILRWNREIPPTLSDAALAHVKEWVPAEAARMMADKMVAEGVIGLSDVRGLDKIRVTAELGVVPASSVKKIRAWGFK